MALSVRMHSAEGDQKERFVAPTLEERPIINTPDTDGHYYTNSGNPGIQRLEKHDGAFYTNF